MLRLFACIILALPFLGQMFGLYALPAYVEWTLATIAQIGGCWPFYSGTYRAIESKRANMDVLVALGTTSAYLFSIYGLATDGHLYFETSVFLITLILLGRYLESRSYAQAGSGMKALLELQVKVATVKKDEKWIKIPIEEVGIGDLIVVKPGERVPVDGTVTGGHSSVDEAFLTGESLPVTKEINDSVLAGSINGNGMMEIRAEKLGAETALGTVIRLVDEAQKTKAPIQKLADRICAVFVPCVLGVSVLTLLLWWIFGTLGTGILSAVAVLVIACPCALGLATPTVVMVTTAKSADLGILIKNAESLEMMSKLQRLLVDKTGTVTEGTLQVTKVETQEEPSLFLSRIIGLARHSDHPASVALLNYAKASNIEAVNVVDFTAHPGMGVEGVIDGKNYMLGSGRFLEANGVNVVPSENTIAVHCAVDQQWLGVILFEDKVRAGGSEAVDHLKHLGIGAYLLSGDREAVVKKVAEDLGMDGYFAEVLPENKAGYVDALKKEGYITGMVGDGINDAPALAASDVGFAIASGTDVAMESASVGLMQSHLSGVVIAVRLARVAMRKIRQNLWFAFVYNVLAIPLAAAGILHPIVAAIAMALSSISVILNAISMRLTSTTPFPPIS